MSEEEAATEAARALAGRKKNHRGGRPPKLTPEHIELARKEVKTGCVRSVLAARLGMNEATLYRHLAAGRDALERKRAGARLGRADELAAVFCEVVTLGDADSKQAGINVILQAAMRGSWQAALKYLRIRWPKEFAEHHVIRNEDETDEGGNPTGRRTPFEVAVRGKVDPDALRRELEARGLPTEILTDAG